MTTTSSHVALSGQSLWLDNITRDLLNNGTLEHYIHDLSITGLASNPTIFDHVVKNSAAYDSAILDGSRRGKSGETVFFDLALNDITRAAVFFDPFTIAQATLMVGYPWRFHLLWPMRFSEEEIDIDALGRELQNDGAKSFVRSWIELMDVIGAKGAELARVGWAIGRNQCISGYTGLMKNPTRPTAFAFSLVRSHHHPMSGALRRTMPLDRTTVFGLWDAMSRRKNFANKIVEAEAEPSGKSASAGRNGVDDHERRRR
jgi:Transaldolase/Fructose-6-phosphate aldolase